MQKIFFFFYKAFKYSISKIVNSFDFIFCYLSFYLNGVKFSSFKTTGWPKISISNGGHCIISEGFKSNNRESSNPIGRFNRCSIFVGKEGNLFIGKNVGMSSTAIVCHNKINIGDNVKIGGNTVIYDTDFHSLNHIKRLNSKLDKLDTKTKPVIISNNVFIGAHSTILKGVTIGENSIIGACSVVSKSIPDNEIWAGNPIKFIKKINNH